MARNDASSRLDLERNRSRNFIKKQIEDRLRGDATSLVQNVPDKMPSPVDEGGLTEAAFNKAIQRMIAASGGKISVRSGRRSPERQAQLWAEAVKKYGDPEIADNWVARPGHSKHEVGLAADLAYADAAAKSWAHQNAAQFGIHFPLANEDWHAELMGTRGGETPKGSSPVGAGPTPVPTGEDDSMFKLETGWQKPEDEDLKTFIEKRLQKKSGNSVPTSGGSVQNVNGRKSTGDPYLDEIIYGTDSTPGESNFRTDADNPSSSAFGIGQLIESNRQHYGQRLGIDPNTLDEAEQLALMRAYVNDRYGSPQAAVEFRRQNGWY